MARIGRRSIVSFPNFGYWRVRMSLAWWGRMPVTENLPHQWYDTPNIHFCTIRDFVALAREMNLGVERGLALNGGGRPKDVNASGALANILAEQAVFLLRRD
jgi:methionine biosynthesis protein MetW